MLNRRAVLAAGLAAPSAAFAASPWDRLAGPQAALTELEQRSAGRLGVAVLDTGDLRRLVYNGHQQFPMCSTFKVLAASAVLARTDRGEEKLDRRIVYADTDLVANSPTTEKHVGGDGLSLAELAEAAITLSDNTAANLLLKTIGGPQGLTAFVRTLGDRTTRLDRWETELNSAIPGDPRDTTTPDAMLTTLHKLLTSPALSAAAQTQLVAWMAASQTGAGKLRAGIPADWRIGDKTGSGSFGATNEVAILWRPGKSALLACVYTAGSASDAAARNAVIAEVGRIITAWV